MKNKIFKVIGISIGMVLAFVGVVVGVMAIRGDFKTPIVYPSQLSFEENNFEVVNDYSGGLKSFMLTGATSGKHPVNKKVCYLNFVNNEGEDLITLCDSAGNPLARESNLSYKVNCNEPIYYKFKEVSASHYLDASNTLKETYGRVVLEARDERNLLTPAQLIFWVDMQAQSVKIANLELQTDELGENLFQEASLSLGSPFYFNFETNPSYAFHPISIRESSKNVEVYFIDETVMTNYVRVDGDYLNSYIESLADLPNRQEEKEVLEKLQGMLSVVEFNNDGSPFGNAENVLTFRTSNDTIDSGEYHFRFAMFPSYFDQDNYLPDEQETNLSRTEKMLHTDLYIRVDNYDVEAVNLSSQNVNLYLYSNYNYITLNGEPEGLDRNSINNNNLGLNMVTGDERTNYRFNEVNFGVENVRNWLMDEQVLFVNRDNSEQSITFKNNLATVSGFENLDSDNYAIVGNVLTIGSTAFTLEKDVIKINGRELIKSISCVIDETTLTFISARGAVFVEYDQNQNGSFRILNTGSYLGFYANPAEDSGMFELKADFFEFTASGSFDNRTFNIIPKKIVDNLSLIILVVNSNGEYHFASTNVTISVQQLREEYTNLNRNYTLNVTYVGENVVNYEELAFDEIVNIISGSYNAGVLVTPQSNAYSIDVLEDIQYSNGETTYVLVGYFDGLKFVNAVRARNYGNSAQSQLYLITLKNEYQETSSDIIKKIITKDGLSVNFVYGDDKTITVSLVLDEFGQITAHFAGAEQEELSLLILDDVLYVEQGADRYKCTLTSFNSVVGLFDQVASEIDLAKDIKINNKYYLSTEMLQFNFHACDGDFEDESQENADMHCRKDGEGNIHYLEDTDGHTIEITSINDAMLLNLINDISETNFTVYMVDANGNRTVSTDVLTLSISTYNDDIVAVRIGVEVGRISQLNGQYFIITMSVQDQTIESPHIYIDSDEATDIKFVVGDEEGGQKEFTLDSTRNDKNALTITIGYENGAYKYVCSIEGILDSVPLSELNLMFNSEYPSETAQGFKVLPGYQGKIYNLTYSSSNTDYLKFNEAGELEILKVTNSIGDVYIVVNCDAITRYLPVKIVTDGNFNFESSDLRLSSSSTINLSDEINYTYKTDGVDQYIKNSDFFTISNVRADSANYTVKYEEDSIKISDSNDHDVVTFTANVANKEIGWQITRSGEYAYMSISIYFDVSVITSQTKRSVTINFTNDLTIMINLEDYPNFYANTKILLAEKQTSSEDFVNKPMFKIIDRSSESANYGVRYTHLGEVTQTDLSSEITLELGNYLFEFYKLSAEEETLISYNIDVVPNIVATITGPQQTAAQNLKSATDYNVSDIITLKSYKTDITFGKAQEGEVLTYSSDSEKVMTDFVDFENLTVDGKSLDENKFTTEHIEEIYASITRGITISYLGFSQSVPVKISNKYNDFVKFDDSVLDEANTFEIRAKTPETCPISINFDGEIWALSSVSLAGEDLEFEVAGNQFTLTQNITRNYENANLIFSFTFNEKTLIFKSINNTKNLTVTIMPHIPDFKGYTAYSNSEFDLIADVFNLRDGEGNPDKEIQEIVVQSIGPNDANAFVDTSFVGARKYIKGDSNNTGCQIQFAGINGKTRQINITYFITYTDGTTYYYAYPLTIENWQNMKVNYPYADKTEEFANIGFEFADGISESDQQQFAQESDKVEFTFEPVVNGQKITFVYDDNLKFSRIEMTDNQSQGRVGIVSQIELIAYETGTGVSLSNVSGIYEIQGKSIIFKNGAIFTTVYLVFKVTSDSGNFVYYYVNLANKTYVGEFANVNTNSRWDIYNIVGENAFYSYNDNKIYILGEELTDETLQDKFKTSNLQKANFKIYLLDATLLDGSNFYNLTGIERFSQPINLPPLINFCTITLALVYDSENSTILLGTIVAEIKPNLEISVDESVTQAETSSNGIYELNSSNLTLNSAYENPFTIKDLSGLAQDCELELNIVEINNSNFTTDGETVQFDGKNLLQVQDGAIKLLNYPAEALEIKIQYTFTLTSNSTAARIAAQGEQNKLVLILNLKISSMEIQATHSKQVVGNYTGSQGFKDTLVLNEGENAIISENYKGAIHLDIDGTKYENISLSSNSNQSSSLDDVGSYSVENGKLTITFSLIGKTYTFKITFLNILPVKEASFNVETTTGVYTAFTSGSRNGQNQSTPFVTSREDASYTSEVASRLEIIYSPSSTIYQYHIGAQDSGLNIYSNKPSKLQITPLNNDDSKFIKTQSLSEISQSTTIEFYHLAKTTTIPFKIDLQDGENKSLLPNQNLIFFVKLEQTYNGIKSVYPLKGAEYENVVSEHIISDIRNNLFSENLTFGVKDLADNTLIYNARRVALVDLFDNLIFDYDIGFTTVGNPNHIAISEDGNVFYNSDGSLSFGTMTNNNQKVSINLSNNSGMPAETYNYQIIGNYEGFDPLADGLTFSTGSQTNLQTVQFDIIDSDLSQQFNFSATANLIDKNSNSLFLTKFSAQLNGESMDLSSAKYQKTNNGNEIIYTITINNFSFTITKTANAQLVLSYARNIDQDINEIQSLSFDLELYGESGLLVNLSILINNRNS